eukprot:6192650-Pleurochrysis_carterae.AAC.2
MRASARARERAHAGCSASGFPHAYAAHVSACPSTRVRACAFQLMPRAAASARGREGERLPAGCTPRRGAVRRRLRDPAHKGQLNCRSLETGSGDLSGP